MAQPSKLKHKMGIASRRTLRNLLARTGRNSSKQSKYDPLHDDDDEKNAKSWREDTTSPRTLNTRTTSKSSVTVSVTSLTPTAPLVVEQKAPLERDTIVVSLSVIDGNSNSLQQEQKEQVEEQQINVTTNEDEKEEELVPDNTDACGTTCGTTQEVATEMVRQTSSSFKEMVARTMAATTVAAAGAATSPDSDPANTATGGKSNSGDATANGSTELPPGIGNDACRCADQLVETSKECVDSALKTTQKAATDLVEASAHIGREIMASTEESSQAALQVDNFPIHPVVEQTSEQLENAYASAAAEVQEFVDYHVALLEDHIRSSLPLPPPSFSCSGNNHHGCNSVGCNSVGSTKSVGNNNSNAKDAHNATTQTSSAPILSPVTRRRRYEEHPVLGVAIEVQIKATE